jgi:hypothetical protein
MGLTPELSRDAQHKAIIRDTQKELLTRVCDTFEVNQQRIIKKVLSFVTDSELRYASDELMRAVFPRMSDSTDIHLDVLHEYSVSTILDCISVFSERYTHPNCETFRDRIKNFIPAVFRSLQSRLLYRLLRQDLDLPTIILQTKYVSFSGTREFRQLSTAVIVASLLRKRVDFYDKYIDFEPLYEKLNATHF